MGDFADAADPLAALDVETGQDDAATLKESIQGASWQVQGINWIYEQVTGQNLVESLIAPITGDFAKIAQNADAWKAVGESLRGIRENINHGVSDLRVTWDGAGAMAFETMMVGTWTVALEADAAIANLISAGFTKAAETSEMMCGKILELVTKLVNRLIQAACTAWIPVGGWANAVRIVIRCIDIVFMILDMIQAMIQLYQGIVQMVNGIKAAGTSLSRISEISGGEGSDPRSLGDAMNLALDKGGQLSGAATQVTDAANQVRDSATQVRDGVTQTREGAAGVRQSVGDMRNNRGGGGGSGASGNTGSPEGYQTALSGNL